MDIRARIRRKFELLSPAITERTRRLWAGAEADAIGHGGVSAVAAATGMAISTVRKGRDEVRAGVSKDDVVRDRRPGAGRKRLEKKDPAIPEVLESLVDPAMRGDPESPLRWTSKSTRTLARELTRRGHPLGANKVAQLLHLSGYSLQGTSRVKEGQSHPDRNAQFEYINARSKEFISRNVPVISVDTKKKEAVGEFANAGRDWQRKGKAVEVVTYDFFDASAPKAIPYGVYDIAQNNGYVNVGTDHDTPVFAAHSIGRWWTLMGCLRYPDAKELFITADSGGSNSRKSHVWKAELQELADRHRLTIHVSHFPPGTSKWNKIEHRLFSFISLNWRGRPLTTYQTIVSLIAATTTQKGLKISAELDKAKYPIGVKVKKHVLRCLHLKRDSFHGEWNYTLRPRTEKQLAFEASAMLTARDPVSHAERKAKWMQLVVEQRESGLSNREFCRRRKINFDSFIHARRRIVGRIRARSKDDR